jgi:hypothetical protein
VAAAGISAARSTRGSHRRAVEWGVLSVTVCTLVVVFMHWAQRIQGQVELATVQSTLGALRSAAVVDDLQRRMAGRPSGVPRDPFGLLGAPPGNYLGSLSGTQAIAVRAGSWWFDPDCACIGYMPMDARWLDSASGAGTLRFRVESLRGPLELRALESYTWQGHPIQ